MYVYLDKNGTVKEIVNDEALRQASSNANTMYVYYEAYKENDISSVLAAYELPDGTVLDESEVATSTVVGEVPYSAERDLKYFKYYTDYPFYVFDVSDEALAQNGTVRLTLRMVSQSSESIRSMGLITFDVSLSVMKSDFGISVSQYNYLIKQWMGSAEGDYLPLDGSKPMQGDLNMLSYFIKLNGLYLKNEDGTLTFNGKPLAKKEEVVTLSGTETITGSKSISDAHIHLQGKTANTYVNVEDEGSDFVTTVRPASVSVQEEGYSTEIAMAINSADNPFLEIVKEGKSTLYEQDKIEFGNYTLSLPSKSGMLAVVSDIPTDYATTSYVDGKLSEYQPLDTNLTSIANTLKSGSASGYLYFNYYGGKYHAEMEGKETLYNATAVIDFQFTINGTAYVATCSVPFVSKTKEWESQAITPSILAKQLNNNGFLSVSGMFYNKNTLDFGGVFANGYFRSSDYALMLNTFTSFGVIVLPADGNDTDYVNSINIHVYYAEVL